MYEQDTIAAIATPPGQGGISVIRVSGTDALTRLRELIVPPADWETLHSHHFYLGRVLDRSGGQPLDRAGLLLMHAPRSYTGEDTLELHLHGGQHLARRTLHAVLAQGIRLAQPGEFTKRAFLNGKLDLAQAEAVLDLIQATNDTGLHLAWEDLSGGLSRACADMRDRLVSQTAHLEAFLDFPEDDVPERSRAEIRNGLVEIRTEAEALATTFAQGKIFRDGVKAAIVGKPNVGKSSLLNLLTGTERAIVTPQPGTTRDVIEETVLVDGIPLVVWDTAGIRRTDDEIERIGIDRSLRGIEQAEIVLAVFDLSQPFDADDRLICKSIEHRPAILIGNKTDLPRRFDVGQFPDVADAGAPVCISARDATGIDALGKRIRTQALGGADPSAGANGILPAHPRSTNTQNTVFITKIRHHGALTNAAASLYAAEQALERDVPLDLVAVELRTALDHIGEITGHVSNEDILDRVFQDFCIGK